MKFNPNPLKLDERVRPYHAQLICASFTTGGRFLAVGGADHYVRVYKVGDPEGVEKLIETEIHADRVDSIQWCHSGVRFVSGSRDGTALIWHYQCQQWKTTQLNMRQTLTGLKSAEECAKKLQVTMVGWDRTDSLVITASSDHLIRVWDSRSGVLKRVLEGHEDNAYVIEAHPTDDRLILTAGHDGLLFIWDVIEGTAVKSFKNSIEGQGHGALFDAKWSPDGLSIATTDSHGHILLFGIGHNELFKKIPQELFFHTDYRPLVRDVNHHVLDEQTQMAPHLMPPPFLVNVDGDPYPPEYQRLVPGREKCRMDQLIPNVVTNDNGEQEVLDLGMGDLEPALPPSSVRVPNEVLDPNPVANGGAFGRPNIDDMIERLAQQHVRRRGESERGRDEEPGPSNGGGSSSGSTDRRGSTSGGGAHADPPYGGGAPGFDPLSPRSGRVGARREGDIEGVRQSTGNWQRDPNMKWKRQLFLAPLTDGALERSIVVRKVNGEMEMATYEEEAKKRPELPQTKAEDEEGGEGSKKNRRRQRKTHAYSTRANGGTEPKPRRGRQTGPRIPTAQSAFGADFEDPDAAIASQEREEEEEDALSSSSSSSCSVAKEALEEEESSSSESDNSTDYSDWTADFGGVGLEPPKRTAHKQKKNPVPVKRKKRRKKKEGEREESDEGEEEEEEEQEEKVVKRKRQKRGEKEEERRPSIRRKRDARCLNMAESDMEGGDIDEIPPEFRPPEWLGETVPKKAPYFPQMGDEIMYFRQGHQLYVEAVINRHLYPIDKRSLPWIRKHNLRDQEFVKIIGIKYEIKPPRLCCLKLGIMDLDGVLTGDSFTIKYHDMPDVLDFLVLKNTYDAAVSRNWQRNDRFRCIIDDAWWIGTVESQEPHLPEFPDSMFMCYRVLWDNGERERLSPWDMEFIDEQMELPDVGGSIQVCPDEYKNLVYTPSPEDWAGSSFESECQRMAEGMGKIMELAAAEPFLTPVDLNVYPNYAMIVEYPMDLSTIKSRLESHFYRRPNAAQFDVRYIATNAEKFNKKGSVIVKHGRIITDLALRLIKDPTCRDPTIYYHEVQNNYQSPSHSEDETRRRATPDSDRKSGRRKSGRARETITKFSRDGSIVLPKHLVDDRPWQQQCRDLLKSMFERQDSVPFRFPVDANRYEDYYQVIDVPMDLSTIREELSAGGYDTPRDFAEDVRLVFQNSKNYNTNNRSRIYSMTVRLEAFFEDQIKGILLRHSGAEARLASLMAGPSGSGSNVNGSGPYENQSDADEDDDDDDDDGDGDALRGSVNEGGKRRSRRVAKLRQLKTNDSEETDSDDEEYSPLKRNPHKGGQPRHGGVGGPSSSKGGVNGGRKSVSPPTPAEKREKGGPVKRTAATKKVRDDDSDFEVPGKRTSSTPSLRPKKVRRYDEDSDLDSKGPSPPPVSDLSSEEDEDLVRRTSPPPGAQRASRASAKKYIKSESSSENEEEVGVGLQNGEGQTIAASSIRRIESSEEEEEEAEEGDEKEKTYVNGTKEEGGEWSIVRTEKVEEEVDEEEEEKKGDESEEEEEDEGQEDEEVEEDDDDEEEEKDKRPIVPEPRQRLTLASFGGRKQREESEFECDDEDFEEDEDEEEEEYDDEGKKKKKKKKGGGRGKGGRVGGRRMRPKAIDGDDVEDDVDFVADDFIDDDEASCSSSSSSSSSDDSNPESRRRKPKVKKKARKLTQKEKEKRSEQAKKERAKRAKAMAREKAKAARAKERAREKAKRARQKEKERERARKEKEEAKAKAKEKREAAKIGRGSGKKKIKIETSPVNSRVSVPASSTAQEVLQPSSSVLHLALQVPQVPRMHQSPIAPQMHQSPIAPQMHHEALNSQMQQSAATAVNPQIHYAPIRPQIHHSPMNPQIIHSPPPSQVYHTPSSPQVHSSPAASNQMYQSPVATRLYQGPVVSQTHFSPAAQRFPPQSGVMSPMHQAAPPVAQQQQYMVPVSTYSSMASYVPIAVNPHQAPNSVSSQPPPSYSAPSSLPQMALAFDSRTQAKQVIHGGRVIGTKITQLGPVSESPGTVTGSFGVATGSSGVATGSSTSGSDDDDDFEPGTSYHNSNGSWNRTRTRRGRIEDDSEEEEEEDEVGRRGRVRKRVRYNEDSEEGEASNSVSSRGRVRKANTRMRDFI